MKNIIHSLCEEILFLSIMTHRDRFYKIAHLLSYEINPHINVNIYFAEFYFCQTLNLTHSFTTSFSP